MKIALFVPCYVDAFYPEVAIAILQLLERLGHGVVVPPQQTCCGQPMANSGDQTAAAATEAHFVDTFRSYDLIVGPSGSCVHHVRLHLDGCEPTPEAAHVRKSIRELVEFLHEDRQSLPPIDFKYKVGLHNGCTALRGLGHARPSERVNEPDFFQKLGRSSRMLVASRSSNPIAWMNAAGSAAASVSPMKLSPPKWVKTASMTLSGTGPRTSHLRTIVVSCT